MVLYVYIDGRLPTTRGEGIMQVFVSFMLLLCAYIFQLPYPVKIFMALFAIFIMAIGIVPIIKSSKPADGKSRTKKS